jgi:hypothetical protein
VQEVTQEAAAVVMSSQVEALQVLEQLLEIHQVLVVVERV